jgi:hypothetical protein
MAQNLDAVERSAQNTTVYWFFVMEEAKDRGDFELAAQAKRELARLGVRVVYGPPSKSEQREATPCP